MKLSDLKSKCEQAIKNPEGLQNITLKIPESPKGPEKRRLFGKFGPFGNVVEWGSKGYDVIIFNAQEVLDFIHSLETEAQEQKK